MFQKVHFKLTLFCAGITIFIIISISCAYLFIAEKNLKKSSFASFQNDMNTLLSNLEDQTVITYEWLSKMEGNGKYQISIWDNGRELLFNNRLNNKERSSLFEAARNYYNEHYKPDFELTPYYTFHEEFSFSGHYVCAAFSQRESGILQVYILRPLAPLKRQIWEQRFSFLCLIFLSSAALLLFAWHFTKKVLAPIRESQKNQIEFVAAASHELRTPLTVLLSAASACENAMSDEQAGFFKIIRDEGLSMSHLISDLLTLAGADSHSWNITEEPCELDTLLLDTYEAFEPLAKEKGYILNAELPDSSLPVVLCDRERTRQVLSILLHNAFCYTPAGSRITLLLEKTEQHLILKVSDNGPGIPDSEKEKLFDRFYRSDSARTVNGHFGLGLCIAREIMQAQHGSIRILDTPGGGATFALYYSSPVSRST